MDDFQNDDSLVERLRRYARFSRVTSKSWSNVMLEAADWIEEAERDRNRLHSRDFAKDGDPE